MTHYAGFWIRFVAAWIDIIVLNFATWFVELLILGVIYWTWLLRSKGAVPSYASAFDPVLVQTVALLIYILLAIPYYGWGTYRFGTTLGKRPFRIYVVQEGTYANLTLRQSLLRCLAYVASYLPFGAGFAMAAVHPKKRALHDLIAGTVSVVRELPESGEGHA
jgi:uncharacterized RDD family membrane protein YckC